MADIDISIETDAVAAQFEQALSRASAVAGDMIMVRTSIRAGMTYKTVRTECGAARAELLQIATVGGWS